MSKSPSYYAWQRLRKNKPAFWGLIYVCFCALIALAGPLILPDSSPDSNEQILELETRKPGFSVQMLKIRKNTPPVEHSVLKKIISGEESDYTYKPFSEYKIVGDSLFILPFGADAKSRKAAWEGFSLIDIVYALPANTLVKRTNDDISFTDYAGKEQNISAGTLASEVKDKHIIKRTYLLGTDRYGRDMLSRLLLGTRISLSVGIISVVISLLVGILLGALAGFFRGRTDSVIQWFINVVWSIPTLLLVMAVSLILGRGYWQVFVAVGLTMWVDVARMVRGQILSARELEYVQAGRALGFGNFRLIFKHILPNILGPVMIISAANFASAILLESGLSFLGVGVQPPAPSGGVMLNDHFGYIVMDAAYLAILPGLAIMFMVLAFNMLGNGLRDALDVRMK